MVYVNHSGKMRRLEGTMSGIYYRYQKVLSCVIGTLNIIRFAQGAPLLRRNHGHLLKVSYKYALHRGNLQLSRRHVGNRA